MMIATMISLMAHISFLLSVSLIIVVAWKCRPSQVRLAFLITLALMTVWNTGTILEMDFRAIVGITYIPFINLCYIGICLIPVAVLYLGMVILQPDWRLKPIHATFLLIPFTSIAIVFTDPLHHLFFVHFSLYSSDAVYGAYYYFHSIYSYGCIAVGIILMFIASTRYTGLFSRQSLLVVSGVVITVVPNMLYSFGVGNLPFSISTAAFTISMLCFSVAFLKYRFITSLPITLKQVVNLINDGYLVVDKDFCILTYNRALLRLFPEPINISLGQNLRSFIERYFLDTSYDRFLDLQAKAAAQRETVTAEGHIAGDTYVSVEITPVMQRNTQIGSIILLKDITQSKMIIKATEAANRAKSEFLANMSHEIRTPMNAIIGMVAIGKSTADIERKNYSLTKIEDASKHLLGVINEILDMSKIEAGKFELSPVEFNFEKMIQRVVDIISFRAETKHQKFMIHIDTDIPKTLIGDDQRIAQVITNLLGNAVKFTPERGVINLDAHYLKNKKGKEGDDTYCTIQIEVIDTGIGISPEQQARLFQSFTQADSDTSRNFGGTGLGLAISKSIVEMMGGKIWLESAYGKGSSFIFTIHVKPAEIQEQQGSDQQVNWGNLRILAVDDDSIILSYIEEIMRSFNVSCDTAICGEDALRLIVQNGHYDIYFLDWKMPGIDGIELTKQLKAIPTTHGNYSVVLFSAEEWGEIEKEAKQAGVDKFLSKPLFPSAIADIINDCIGLDQKHHEKIQLDINGIFSGCCILLVDDIEINREIVVALLEPTLIQIDCAENGLQAVQMFGENPKKYELIFMDVQMPEMDGYEATHRIRKMEEEIFTASMAPLNEKPKGVPIIAMTANVFREDLQKCLDAGMNDHTGKPLEFAKVLDKLRTYLHPKH